MPGTAPRVVLLVACFGAALACVFLAERGVQSPPGAAPTPAPEHGPLPLVRTGYLRVLPSDPQEKVSLEKTLEKQWPERRAGDPRENPPVQGAITLAMREFVDMSSRVSTVASRVNGMLWLAEDGRAYVRVWMDQLLEGGAPVDPTVRNATGTWKRDGDHLVVEGLDVVVGTKAVFGTAGTTRRWRLEGDLALVHADPFKFERGASR